MTNVFLCSFSQWKLDILVIKLLINSTAVLILAAIFNLVLVLLKCTFYLSYLVNIVLFLFCQV